MRLVLDSSCLCKLAIREEGSDEMYALVEEAAKRGAELLASDLALYEFGNVCWKYSRKQTFDFGALYDDMRRLNIEFVPLSPTLARRAFELARRDDITFYDAAHAAVAHDRGAPLVTADGALRRRVRGALDIAGALRAMRDAPEDG